MQLAKRRGWCEFNEMHFDCADVYEDDDSHGPTGASAFLNSNGGAGAANAVTGTPVAPAGSGGAGGAITVVAHPAASAAAAGQYGGGGGGDWDDGVPTIGPSSSKTLAQPLLSHPVDGYDTDH